MKREGKSRPAGNPSGFQKVPTPAASLSVDAANEVARVLDGVLVVVVVLPNQKIRRRVFLTLASAQRHADRARENGNHVRVILAQLAPISEVRA